MKLSDFYKKVKVEIPDTDLVVEIKSDLSWFEQLEYINIKDGTEKSKYLLLKLITGWNLEDDKGKVLSVTKENIERLPNEIIAPITTKLTKIIEERASKKKT